MTIELSKTEELDGEIWWRIKADNDCLKSFCQSMYHGTGKTPEQCAIDFYNDVVERKKNGYPKKETILTETIETA